MSLLGANGKPLKRSAPEPVIETTHAENLAARKFLSFLLNDLHYQAREMAADPKVTRKELADAKGPAAFLHSYLAHQIKELDRVIGIVDKQEELIQHRLKEYDAEDDGMLN
jgi:cation transport regulator ChaC